MLPCPIIVLSFTQKVKTGGRGWINMKGKIIIRILRVPGYNRNERNISQKYYKIIVHSLHCLLNLLKSSFILLYLRFQNGMIYVYPFRRLLLTIFLFTVRSWSSRWQFVYFIDVKYIYLTSMVYLCNGMVSRSIE